MTLDLRKHPDPEPVPTLAATVGYGDRTRWRQIGNVQLTYFEDEPEYIEVYRVKKRNLHVVSDQMLRARASVDELPEHLSGLRLSSFPV